MKYEHTKWVQLSRREAGAFALLPLYARALAAELLKVADDEGRIFVGSREPWEVIAKLCGAETGDRRLLRAHIPQLLEAGALERDGEYLVLRQDRWSGSSESRRGRNEAGRTGHQAERDEHDSERADNESEREANDRSTNQERAEHEPKTKSDSSARNDSTVSLAGADARSEQRKQDDKREQNLSLVGVREDGPAQSTSGAPPVEPKPPQAPAGRAAPAVPAPAQPAARVDYAEDPGRLAAARKILRPDDEIGWDLWRLFVRSDAIREAEDEDHTTSPGSIARQAEWISARVAELKLDRDAGIQVAQDIIRETESTRRAAGDMYAPPPMKNLASLIGRFFKAQQLRSKAGGNGTRARASPGGERSSSHQPAGGQERL